MENANKTCAIKGAICNMVLFFNQKIDLLIEKFENIDSSRNLRQRVISSLILAPIMLYAIFVSEDLFLFLTIALAILMTIEWLDIIRDKPHEKRWRVIGFLYIAIPLYSVYKLRIMDVNVLFWMFAIIWATDIFAYFAGRKLGGPKLAPSISPNKTWSGLAGGVIASAIIGLISSSMFMGGAIFFMFISVLLSLVEQVSDLLESKFKRIFVVKDSGRIIPGHGGVLDRLDGMMLSAPFVLFLVVVFAKKFIVV